MSYCRFGEADVYIMGIDDGRIECCGCPRGFEANPDWDPVGKSPAFALLGMIRSNGLPTVFDHEGMLEHVAWHRSLGDVVPADVDERLRAEIAALRAGGSSE